MTACRNKSTNRNEWKLTGLSSFLSVHTSGRRSRAFTWDTFKSSNPRDLIRQNWSSVCTLGKTLPECAPGLRTTLESSWTAHPALTWSNPHFTSAQIQESKPCFWSNTVVPAGAKVIEGSYDIFLSQRNCIKTFLGILLFSRTKNWYLSL